MILRRAKGTATEYSFRQMSGGCLPKAMPLASFSEKLDEGSCAPGQSPSGNFRISMPNAFFYSFRAESSQFQPVVRIQSTQKGEWVSKGGPSGSEVSGVSDAGQLVMSVSSLDGKQGVYTLDPKICPVGDIVPGQQPRPMSGNVCNENGAAYHYYRVVLVRSGTLSAFFDSPDTRTATVRISLLDPGLTTIAASMGQRIPRGSYEASSTQVQVTAGTYLVRVGPLPPGRGWQYSIGTRFFAAPDPDRRSR